MSEKSGYCIAPMVTIIGGSAVKIEGIITQWDDDTKFTVTGPGTSIVSTTIHPGVAGYPSAADVVIKVDGQPKKETWRDRPPML